MKSDRWPIIVEGKTYKIEETFSNEPTIYKATEKEGKLEHITGGETNARSITQSLKPGQVIIIASL